MESSEFLEISFTFSFFSLSDIMASLTLLSYSSIRKWSYRWGLNGSIGDSIVVSATGQVGTA